MILKLYYFFQGYLYVTLKGNNVKRFLNLCTLNDINLWEIRFISNECYECRILWRDIYRMVPSLRKTRTKIHVLSKNGFPYQRIRFRNRKIGILSFVAVWLGIYALSLRIWSIELVGNSHLSREELLRFLSQNHISYGTRKKEIDCESLELELRREKEEVIWASAYTRGTKLILEIQESLKTGEGKSRNSNKSCDLIAKKEGVIASIVTRAGVPKVVKGDRVQKGDILIASAYPIVKDDETIDQYVMKDADGDVMGYVVYDYEDTLPIREKVKVRTGKSHSRYQVILGGKSIRIPTYRKEYKEYEACALVSKVKLIEDLELPISLISTRVYQEEYREVNHTAKEAEGILTEKLEDFIEDLEENGVLIISKNVIMEKKGEIYYMHGKIQTCENIGKKRAVERRGISQEDTETE